MQKMSEKEAIEWLKAISATQKESIHMNSLLNRKEALHMAIQALEEIQQYRAIGTLDECREAVERMKPKSPTYDGDGYAPDGTFVWDEWLCPNCGSRYEVDFDEYDHCPNCGQAILREEAEEALERM